MFWNSSWLRGRYRVYHLSDVLRFALLHRFGGTYLDSDCITQRRLPTGKNSSIKKTMFLYLK